MEITKEEFLSYEEVRKSGCINMFHINGVVGLTDLTREQVFYIMDHYDELKGVCIKWKIVKLKVVVVAVLKVFMCVIVVLIKTLINK